MPPDQAKVAVYWDSSYLWGLIVYRTFRRLGLDFTLLSAADIRRGGLDGHDVVFVPGGWASDKMAALGAAGADAVRDFVSAGGGYLGVCGGAGLALRHESGLGLAPFGRKPSSARLPSFSGGILLKHDGPGHRMWEGVTAGAAFHAWWPGQFSLDEKNAGSEAGISVLARYGSPMPGSFVTDLPVGPDFDWNKWEQAYGINLNPARITGEPAVVELRHGRGKVVLSYPHFETPGDTAGHTVLLNLLAYLSNKRARPEGPGTAAAGSSHAGTEAIGDAAAMPANEATRESGGPFIEADGAPGAGGRCESGTRPADLGPAAAIARDLKLTADGFITFGARNFLWYWRSDWLLQWRRGVKGIEYSTIRGMLAELDRLMKKYGDAQPGGEERMQFLKELVVPFFLKTRELIVAERFAMCRGPLSPLKSDDGQINVLREALFSTTKRCGGLYEEILNQVDALLLPLMRRELREIA